MARTGRPPKPTALKVLNGSAEHHPERRNRDEPTPQGVPVMPADLSDAEQEVWRHVTGAMPSGVITAADRDVLRLYCEHLALEGELRGLVRRMGLLVRSSSHAHRDELTKNPLLSALRAEATLVRALAADLGLTPSARSGLHAPATPSRRSHGCPPRPATPHRMSVGPGAGGGGRPGEVGHPIPSVPTPRPSWPGASWRDRLVRLACQRHLDDIVHGKERGLRWDLPEAQRVIDLIAQLRLPSGEPFILQPAQAFIVGSPLRLVRGTAAGASARPTSRWARATARRRSPLPSGIVGLVADGRNAAEVYTAGVTRDQAQLPLGGRPPDGRGL